MNIHFQGKGWVPSPCPPQPPRPSVYCTCYPGNPMGRMQIRGPTMWALVSPHNSLWWCLILLFMERAGGSHNMLQIIAHPKFPLLHSVSNLPYISLSFLSFLFLRHSLFFSLHIYIQSIFHFSFSLFSPPPPTLAWQWGPQSSRIADGGSGLREVSVI